MRSTRLLEGLIIALMMVLVLLGGRAWVLDIAQFHGVAVSMLVILGVAVVYAFRRNFLAGGPNIRIEATAAAAFLAGIAAAIAFIISPARWSLGATIAAIEFGLVIALLMRFSPSR